MQELMRESRGDFKSFLRMEPEMFREMLDRVTPRIEKSQEGRPPLSPGLKLAITLRFLSTGTLYHSLADSCFMRPSALYKSFSSSSSLQLSRRA